MSARLAVVASTVAESPYPAETSVRGYRFELDLDRIRTSDTWALAPAEIRPWLLMLWATAWLETPAGSLPADDRIVAAKIGMPIALFQAHRDVVLRGWSRRSDGRLYHAVLIERVAEMLHRRDRAVARQRKHRETKSTVTTGESRSVTCDVRIGTGTGTGKTTTTKTQGAPRRSPAAPVCPDGVSPQAWNDWLTARKAKHLPLTPTALQAVEREAAKAKLSLAQAIETAAANSWAGFKASWLLLPDTKRPGGSVERPKEWHETQSGIRARATEFGIEESDYRLPDGREDWLGFRTAVYERAGIYK